MNAVLSPSTVTIAEKIRSIHAEEAHHLMQVSFNRFMQVIESLAPEDWTRPTACTEWNVHDMVAHQAGGYASGTGYREMLRQYTNLPRGGQLPEDAINALQVGERKDRSPGELIQELKQVGEKAIHNWAYGFRAIKWITIPHPVAGWLSLRQLMWVTHSRDTWMHRLDICRATHRPFEQTREHDGRINELVVMDVAKKITGKLDKGALLLMLTGPAGGMWKIGKGDPTAGLEMDMLDFNIFVSGRFTYEQAMERAVISGDRSLIEKTFRDLLVLY